jgi:hypothetical protein
VTNLPPEVIEAGQKVEALQKQGEVDLARIKGPSEDSPTRAAAAVQLRVDGASYADIAKVLDYTSAAKARMAVERALADETATPEQIEHVRWMNARRLEKILNSLMRRATNPKDPDHLQYARMAVVVVDRHLRLYGADAPQKMNVTYSPAAGELEAWVMQTARQVASVEQEADIIDGEVEES